MSTSDVLDSQTHVPDFLQCRNFPANPSRSKGYLMDVEVIILTFLNDDGKLASKEKLEDFMAIITRMESVRY